jgi:hypothetical protein
MAIASSTSFAAFAPPSVGTQSLRAEQARRNAERAEQAAQALHAQAKGAQRQADRAQENARDLTVRSAAAESAAGQARQGLAALDSANRALTRLGQTVARAAAGKEEPAPSPAASAASAVSTPPSGPTPAAQALTPPRPVVNTSGQVTGTLINLVA